jgi:hypothetical protein
MSTDDNDLSALRSFRRALDTPPEGVLVRGRYRLASSEYRPPRRRPQWLLTSAGAAVAVAVVVGAAAAVHSPAVPGPGGQAPAARPSAAPGGSSAGKVADLPVTPGTRAPGGATITSDGGATHAKAVAAMDRLAGAAASTQPTQVPSGKVLYIKTYDLKAGSARYVHEIWLDPTIMVPLRVRKNGDGDHIDSSSTQAEIDQAAAEPPNLYRPTAAYLASLPTDPAQLIAQWRQWAQTTYPGRPADGMIWKDTYKLINYSEPFWTPQQRAAVYGALARMPDLKATTAKIDNRPYDLVCLDRGGATADCLLFDSTTGRYAGNAAPGADLALNSGNVYLVDYGIQPPPARDDRPATKPTSGSVTKPVMTGTPPPGK